MKNIAQDKETFHYHFNKSLPRSDFNNLSDLPLLGSVHQEAKKSLRRLDAFMRLPSPNRELVSGMVRVMIEQANNTVGSNLAGCRQNFWSLYIVGSRATRLYRDSSNLDLLSVSSFSGVQDFSTPLALGYDTNPFNGFEVNRPPELPEPYNIGETKNKKLIEVSPKEFGVLPVNICVVNLGAVSLGIDEFITQMDVDNANQDLPKTLVASVTIEHDRW